VPTTNPRPESTPRWTRPTRGGAAITDGTRDRLQDRERVDITINGDKEEETRAGRDEKSPIIQRSLALWEGPRQTQEQFNRRISAVVLNR
jgi:hypothetical protein